MHPKASLVILTYNNLDYTRQCLESIDAKTTDVEFEVIVVDNASTDATPEYLRQYAANKTHYRLVFNAQNEGFARGNNIGAAAATGDVIVFLNNDVLVTAGWLSGLIRYLRQPDIGMVGPVTNAAGNECRIPVAYQEITGMDRFAEAYTRQHAGEAFEISLLPFQCVALRREVWEAIGPLDERFGIGMFEDDDYAMRLRQAGYKMLCAEDVFVHHWGSISFTKLAHQDYWRLFVENRRKFEGKWAVQWQPHLVRPALLGEQAQALAHNVFNLNELVLKLQEDVAWQEGHIHHLTQTNQQLSGQLSDAMLALDEANARVLQVNAKALQALDDAYAKTTQLNMILSSRTYRLALIFQAFRKFFVPEYSRRERFVRSVADIGRILLRQGIVAFLRQILSPLGRSRPIQSLSTLLGRALPAQTRRFWETFRQEAVYPNRRDVVLYADPDVLPAYSNRRLLQPSESVLPQVTLIATLRNEAAGVRQWIESILAQSRLPDEIVITDGGSSDDTVAIIRQMIPSFPISLKLIEAPQANIAQGRNLAIRHALHPIVVCSDAGSTLDKDWLKNLVAPFQNDPQVMASMGFFRPFLERATDRLYGSYFIADLEAIDPQAFVPSGRALAIRKALWERIGGFPEWLSDAGEDTLFGLQAQGEPGRWAFVPQATVVWHAPRSLVQFYKKIHRYSKGEGEAGLFGNRYWEKWIAMAWWVAVWGTGVVAAGVGWVALPPLWNLVLPFALLLGAIFDALRRVGQVKRWLKIGTGMAAWDSICRAAFSIAQLRGFMAGVKRRVARNL